MIVEVIYGENVDIAAALACGRCRGTGRGRWEDPCPACDGSGEDRHPGYAYDVDGDVKVGALVRTPPNWRHGSSVATVIKLGSTFDDEVDSATLIVS